MSYQFNFSKEKNYFLVPEMPTPNGRMHLGHLAGPYLKMDVIKRKVKRGEGLAYIASGSDVYESYVELKAVQLDTDERQVCNYFHEQILKDFEALNIDFDLYINPLDEKYNLQFISRQKDLMKVLIDSGAVVEREEMFPYDPINKRFLSGCWIKGECPNCRNTSGSYLCENCGTHYRPIDIFTELNYPEAKCVKGKALYLKFDAERLLQKVREIEITFYEEIITRYIELQGPYIRLTAPQKTGIGWNLTLDDSQVLFTYSALLFFSIYCADLCPKDATSVHPFDPESSFITIASFGIDNVVPYLAGVLAGGMELKRYKPFDYLLSNYFYHLNGEKFSTSRLHVIWGSDIVNEANVQSDAVRYYLIKKNPEFEKKNFEVDDFISTINNDLYGKFNDITGEVFKYLQIGKKYEKNNQFLAELERLIVLQNKAVEPPKFNFADTLSAPQAWIDLYNNLGVIEKKANAYWWLKGFAFLTYPVLPEFSTAVWKKLSTNIEITKSNFFHSDMAISNDFSDIVFNRIDYDSMEKCLPQTLKAKIKQL